MIDSENRDKRGRFVKGHNPLSRPKYDHMKKYPPILCATCYRGTSCPEYRSESVCAKKREFKKFTTRNVNDVINELRVTTETSYIEMQFNMIKEIYSGEYDPDVTKLVKKNFKRLLLLYQIYEQIKRNKS